MAFIPPQAGQYLPCDSPIWADTIVTASHIDITFLVNKHGVANLKSNSTRDRALDSEMS